MSDFTDIISSQQISRIKDAFKKNFGFELEFTDNKGSELKSLTSKKCHPDFCRTVRTSASGLRRCKCERLRSLQMAMETGQAYTCLCHAGIEVVCVPIMDGNNLLGGVFFGKCLSETPSQITQQDIMKRLRGLRINRVQLTGHIDRLPLITPRKLQEAADFLFILLYEVTQLDPRIINWHRQRYRQQSQISEFIHEKKNNALTGQYPYKREQQLIGKVKIGDRTGAKEILNSLLGSIMLENPGQLNVLKARLVELLSILSRAAVQGGVDINIMLEKNLDYISKVMNLNTQQDICVWISAALDDFIECVYSNQDAQKVTQIKPALDYVQANYDRQITLADVARSCFLSVSRIAHLFKEQMGITIVDYITHTRIEQAKALLLSTDKNCTHICFEVGYNNQSYFTRTFKDIVGMTPRQFREHNIRPKSLKSTVKNI